jgi:hypothetical protein
MLMNYDLTSERKLFNEENIIRLGRSYGYNECCIKNFVNLLKLGCATPAKWTEEVLGQKTDVGHVLCPMCYDKLHNAK